MLFLYLIYLLLIIIIQRVIKGIVGEFKLLYVEEEERKDKIEEKR